MEQRLERANARLRVFPDARAIFAPEQEWLARHLHPLVSIDLGANEPEWSGWIHLLSPLEPCEGYVGDHTGAAHNACTRENWLAFRLDADDRYRFLGERGYFLLEHAVGDAPVDADLHAEMQAHYAVQQASYEASIQRYRRYGVLTYPEADDPLTRSDWDNGCVLQQLGGTTGYGNWTDCPTVPDAFVMDTADPDNVFPRMRDGRPFRFIASTAGYPWQETGADGILLFYEPESRTVLLTFDWT